MSVPIVAVIAIIAQVTYGQRGSQGFSRTMAMGGGMNGGMASSMGAGMSGGMGAGMSGGMGAGMSGGMGAGMSGGMGGMSGGMGSPVGGLNGGMGFPIGTINGGVGSPMGLMNGGMGSPVGVGMNSDMGSPMGGTMGAGDSGSFMGAGIGMASSIAAAMSASMANNMGANMGANMGPGAGMPQFGLMNQGFGGMNQVGPAAAATFGSGSGSRGSQANDDWSSSPASSGWGSSSSSDGWSQASNEGIGRMPFDGMGPGFPVAGRSRFPMRAEMGASSDWGHGGWDSKPKVDETTITCAFEDQAFRGSVTFRSKPKQWGWGMSRGGVSATIDVTSSAATDETLIVAVTERSRISGGCSVDGLGPLVSRRRMGGWWGMWGHGKTHDGLGTVTVEAGQTRAGVRLVNLPFDDLEEYAGRGFALCTGTESAGNWKKVCEEPIVACCKLGFDNQEGVTPPEVV